jgi:hypothetical protein
MSQVLGAFGLLDFTSLQPVLAWRVFQNLQTIYFFNFQIFSGHSKLRITETTDNESADTGAQLYFVYEHPCKQVMIIVILLHLVWLVCGIAA